MEFSIDTRVQFMEALPLSGAEDESQGELARVSQPEAQRGSLQDPDAHFLLDVHLL